jgi:hypothetical protein
MCLQARRLPGVRVQVLESHERLNASVPLVLVGVFSFLGVFRSAYPACRWRLLARGDLLPDLLDGDILLRHCLHQVVLHQWDHLGV